MRVNSTQFPWGPHIFHGHVSIPLLPLEADVAFTGQPHTLTIPGIDVARLAYIKTMLIACTDQLTMNDH